MQPFTFEELQKILELNPTDLVTDELIFNSVITNLEKQLDYSLADKNYNEIQTVKDHKVYTENDNITEMINIIDMNTKEKVPNCIINGREIFLLSTEYENHVLFLNYNAGFTAEDFPADLKEAIVKLFLLKKKDFIKQTNNEDIQFSETPQEILNIINIYRRKTL